MRVTIQDEIKTFDNINGVFEQIQTFLDESLLEKELYFSHMVIDGVEIYNDYEFYIEDHLRKIENIIIEVKTEWQFTDDIIISIHEYLRRAMPEIKLLSNSFYQSSSTEAWKKLSDLFEAIQWIHGAIMSINNKKSQIENGEQYIFNAASLEGIFPDLLQALEAQDNTLIADLLMYEIIPLLEKLQQLKTNKGSDFKGNMDHAEGKH